MKGVNSHSYGTYTAYVPPPQQMSLEVNSIICRREIRSEVYPQHIRTCESLFIYHLIYMTEAKLLDP